MAAPSFTSSSESRGAGDAAPDAGRTLTTLPRPTAAAWLAIVVAALVAVALDWLPSAAPGEPHVASFPGLASEVLRYDRTNVDGASGELLLLGSSLMRHGVIEEELAREIAIPDLRVFNASLDGGSLWESLREVRRLDRPRTHGPKVAVIEVNRIAFDARRPLSAYGERESAESAGASWVDHVRDALPQRQPIEMWMKDAMYGAVARHAPALVPTPAPQPRALWNVDAITQRRAVREMMPEPMGRSLAGATLSASTLLALRELVLELHRRGYRVVLLQAPMHSEFLRAMRTNPGDAEREAEFQRVVRDRGLTDADTSLTIDDAAALGASDTIFVDYGHLTRAGASLQTERLATFLHRSALFAPLATAAR